MARRGAPPVVVVLNSNEDMVALIRRVLEDEGFATAGGPVPSLGSDVGDLCAFLEARAPAAVVFDVTPPYGANWERLVRVRDRLGTRAPAFVATTTNLARLAEEAGDTGAIEVVGKPFSLHRIVDAVQRAVGGR